jgi:hypothetical protein
VAQIKNKNNIFSGQKKVLSRNLKEKNRIKEKNEQINSTNSFSPSPSRFFSLLCR